MKISGTEIFRCMDHGLWACDIEDSIKQLKSHLEHGILSPQEQRLKWITSKAVMNLISPHYISVYWWEKYEWIFWPIRHINLSIFGRSKSSVIWIIVDSEYRPNDNIVTDGTKHNIIDAQKTPLKERRITWIVINIHELSDENIQEILLLWKKYKKPIYSSKTFLKNNKLENELIEILWI